eukprot:7847962-Alexandrium_andersonii.AAC.1
MCIRDRTAATDFPQQDLQAIQAKLREPVLEDPAPPLKESELDELDVRPLEEIAMGVTQNADVQE